MKSEELEKSVTTSEMIMSEEENEECWQKLENYRVKLISVIDPNRITPYLRQCQVINSDDEEQVFNDPSLVIRKRKVGMLLDILQRTGCKGYGAFLESLELYYPHLYKKITGCEPSRVFSMIIDTAGESSLTQLLMNEMLKLQQVIQEERRKYKEQHVLLCEKDDIIRQMQVKNSELKKHQERVMKMKEERDNLNKELKKFKDENYDLAMRFARQSEEKNAALMKNRDLQLEIEKLKHNLMKAEDDCKVERKQTLKLKNAIEKRPSQDVIYEMQRENALLKAKIQELENPLQVPKEGAVEKMYIQMLEDDRMQALEQHQDLVNSIFNLKMSLRQTEDLRDKYMEEKEVLELQCTTLKKDSKMYKERIEAILQQMEEVCQERDQAMATREQFHTQYSKSLIDKDQYRKQLRELGEKCDDLQIQLYRREGQFIALETKLKRMEPPTPSSDLDDASSRSSQEISINICAEESQSQPDCNEQAEQSGTTDTLEDSSHLSENMQSPVNGDQGRRRIKTSFDDNRRKRALRARNSYSTECYTSGSDTDGTP
ncbi:caspase recruitment domain-containing protein 9 isoform X1 [Bombina bombina]|uniref:caspase recruitment domain-containing protein 9 isoform X1 n=1 Tax=Bombina bombina TaxID=8345 RepID=UPI00235ABAB8|nr:caspase recruitment domain-containing protein 9 isoform X1 [Bombina bombina]